MAPGAQQGLLHGVLGAPAVGGGPQGHRPEGRPVLLVEQADQLRVPRLPCHLHLRQRRTARVNDHAVSQTIPTVSTIAPGTWSLRFPSSPK